MAATATVDLVAWRNLAWLKLSRRKARGLTIRLFKQKCILSGEGEIIKTKGEPMDIAGG